jgi:hypothetical protein
MVAKARTKEQKKPGGNTSPRTAVKIRTGNFSKIRGEVNIAARDIIKNIQTIYERALTPGEIVEKDLQIEVNELAGGIRTYLERLKQQVTLPAASIPYKGLEAYTLSEAGVFFGRDQAINDLRKAMKRGRLTILQAESGAGKTSLLQAGIVPRLIVEKHLVVLIRPQFENPSYTIKKCFVGDLELTPKLARAPLIDFLRRVKKIVGGPTLYLVLDQFEEFFSKHTLEQDRQTFIRELAECLNDATLNVRWVIAITADAFWHLGKFEPHIPNPFSNVQSLYLLDRQSAVDVIAKPAKHNHLRLEPGLIERLLDDLSQPGNELIAPTQIQLVCVALYDDFRGKNQTITLSQYEARGCAQGILSGYIANVFTRYLPQEERAPAYKILEELVTSEKKRILRSRSDLETALGSRGIPPDLIESVLNHLVNQRLLRRLSEDTEHIQYELVHDYLLNEIELDDDLRAIKEAEELLEQGKRNWKKFGVVLNKDTVSMIAKQRKELHLNHEDICLLLMSLADVKRHTKEWRYYVALAKKNHHGLQISNTLAPLLTAESKQRRNQAYKVLWNFIGDCPVSVRPKIIVQNLSTRAPIFLGQVVLLTSLLLTLFAVTWAVSRNQLEKIGWQTLSNLPPNCFSSVTPEHIDISADPSNASDIILFSGYPSNICRSVDAGDSWTSLSRGLPADLKINSVAAYQNKLVVVSARQVFFWNADNDIWEGFSLPVEPGTELRGVSIGGHDHEIFLGRLPHEIISLKTTDKCWKIISANKAVDENMQGTCWNQIDTSSLAGELNFLSTNQKYIVANTSEGLWFSSIEDIEWKKQPDLDGPILSFALQTQSFFDDGVFIVVLPDHDVKKGELGVSELSTINEWPFPSVNGDNVWDWPQETVSIASSKYVFFANTTDSLQRYPGWSIFEREWWRIMREQRATR